MMRLKRLWQTQENLMEEKRQNVTLQLLQHQEKLFSLFDEYARSQSASTSMQASEYENVVHPQQDGDYMNDFDSYSSTTDFTTVKSQLEYYLEGPKLPRNSELNVLEHWKINHSRYPLLALMARDILAILISTVASESAFSIGGRILDPYRSSLKPSTVESLVCLRDWIFAKGAAIQPDVEELCNTILDSKVGEENDDVVESATGTPHTQSSNLANN